MNPIVERERQLCKEDVCMYCDGRALGYKRTPDGPNESGNWTHQYTTTMRSEDRVLCVASSIFARERFERTQSPNGALLAFSTTWPHVLAFAERMEAKLAKNRHKGDRNGWLKMDVTELGDMLEREIKELSDASATGDAESISSECADVANFAMMIADWFTERAKSANPAAKQPNRD